MKEFKILQYDKKYSFINNCDFIKNYDLTVNYDFIKILNLMK